MSTVQKIKEKLSIEDVVGSYIDIQKSGGTLKARCPFHNEKTPSFFISPERSTYYCFGCGAKGDIFEFVQAFENVDFKTALQILADKAGVVIEKYQKDEKGDSKGRLYEAMDAATDFFIENLKQSKDALLYLKSRSLSIEMVREWKVGFAESEWRSLRTHMKAKGFSDKEMLQAGLIKENEKGGEPYDRFRGRIMFPIFDTAGRVIAFSGRILNPEESEAKYLNSPDTDLFDKSRVLYGYHKAKLPMREKGKVILVEGQMDLLLSHQAGCAHTVASSGTALTPFHLEMLRRLVGTLVIAYDADNAGRNASFKAWQMALHQGFKVEMITLPNGLDPADAVSKDPTLWQNAVDASTDVIEYFSTVMAEEADKKAADKILKEKILPLLASVESAIDRARYLQTVSYKSGIPENALGEELSKVKFEHEPMPSNVFSKGRVPDSSVHRAKAFLYFLEAKNDPYAGEFKDALQKINGEISDDGDRDALVFEAELHYGSLEVKGTGAKLLCRLEEEVLKERFAKAMESLKRAEAIRDQAKVEENLALCQALSAQITGLSKKYAGT